MSVNTQYDDLDRKEEQIDRRRASLLAEAILDRIQNGTISMNTETDIRNSIKKYDPNKQVNILIDALLFIAMNNNNKTNRRTNDDDSGRFESKKKVKNRADLFGRYDD